MSALLTTFARIVLVTLVALTSISPTASASEPFEAEVDGDSYVIRGGLLVTDIYPRDREEAAHCPGCTWRVTVICQSWADEAHRDCPYTRLKCPAVMRIAEVFRELRIYSGTTYESQWKYQGHTCLYAGPPPGLLYTNWKLQQTWRGHVPPLSVTTQPPRNTLINFNTNLAFHSASTVKWSTVEVVGTPIKVTAVASPTISCSPQCTVNNGAITFSRSGTYSIDVRTTWHATYSVYGLNPIPIDGTPITQTASMNIAVHSVHTKLIPNRID